MQKNCTPADTPATLDSKWPAPHMESTGMLPDYEDEKMAQQEFEVGDIVKLKSGGPDMTVHSYEKQYDRYWCQWFAGKKLEKGQFNEASLERKASGGS